MGLKKLYIKTYGCQMNMYDSGRMVDILKPLGYDLTETPEHADLVILNTASLPLKARIIQNKKVLVDKDPNLRYSFESLTLREYFDFSIKEKDILYRRYKIG